MFRLKGKLKMNLHHGVHENNIFLQVHKFVRFPLFITETGYHTRQLGDHYSVIPRLEQKQAQTNAVKDHLRSGKPKTTSVHED